LGSRPESRNPASKNPTVSSIVVKASDQATKAGRRQYRVKSGHLENMGLITRRDVKTRFGDLPYVVGLALILLAVYGTFFNRYAFDDSYFGYSIAQTLLAGHGFGFNADSRMVSTSAPLAVPIYALAAYLFGSSIIAVAQVGSALALAIVAFGTYALVTAFAARVGAFSAAAILVSSPFTLLLWSHETLLYMAASILGLYYFASGRSTIAAIALGLATLFRGEALLFLPILWIAESYLHGGRTAVRFALTSLAPYAIWAVFATLYFGTFLSETIASKQAQLQYPTISPYLHGLSNFAERMYAFTPTVVWYPALEMLVLICWFVATACGFIRPVYRWTMAWIAATTLLYVAIGLPFYFWFCVQIGVLLSATAAVMWPARATTRFRTLAPLGRAAALLLVALNLTFLAVQVKHPERKTTYYDWVIMPSLQGNAYESLGLWFARHADKDDTIAYNEFGQIHYYSEKHIVDYLGIATPGAAAHLKDGNPIWTFKTYRATWYVHSPTWNYFVDPLEYDWFRSAYGRVADLRYPGDPNRNRLTIYKLRRAGSIPPPDERDGATVVRSFEPTGSGFAFTFLPTKARMSEIEVRIRRPAGCNVVHATLTASSERIAERRIDLAEAPAVSRVTLAFPPRSDSGVYRVEVKGCPRLTVAPPDLLRRGFVLNMPATEHGSWVDALIVYVRAS
jgi:hypothetical protein